jgi:hypothetical protein
METVGNIFYPKKTPNYCCNFCDFNSCNYKDYKRHLGTRKHEVSVSGNKLGFFGNKTENLVCNCGQNFKTRSGLWKHKNKCKYLNELETNSQEQYDYTQQMMFFELLKQNNEFKELIKEQNKQNIDFKEIILEQNKQIIEISKEKTMTNCHNTTNNNNNHFNLQFFLNNTCKDAMNISDFINQIQLKLNDLEETGRLGYVEGISRIFVKGLKDLEVNQRPIHCSDAKRETLYIKDGDIWEKDDVNKSKLTNAIKQVAHKNIKQIPLWVKEHPNCQQSESRKNDLYLRIVSNSMSGGTDEEADKNYNKIVKNIIKEVIINKI